MLPLADREKTALAMHVAQRQFFGKINHCWRFSMFSMQSTTVSQCPAKVFSELLQHPKLSTVIISPKMINYYHIAHNDQLLSYHPKLSVIIISLKIINYNHITQNDQFSSYHPKLSIIIISPKMTSCYNIGCYHITHSYQL